MIAFCSKEITLLNTKFTSYLMNHAMEGHSQPQNDMLFVQHSGLMLENFSHKKRANLEREILLEKQELQPCESHLLSKRKSVM